MLLLVSCSYLPLPFLLPSLLFFFLFWRSIARPVSPVRRPLPTNKISSPGPCRCSLPCAHRAWPGFDPMLPTCPYPCFLALPMRQFVWLSSSHPFILNSLSHTHTLSLSVLSPLYLLPTPPCSAPVVYVFTREPASMCIPHRNICSTTTKVCDLRSIRFGGTIHLRCNVFGHKHVGRALRRPHVHVRRQFHQAPFHARLRVSTSPKAYTMSFRRPFRLATCDVRERGTSTAAVLMLI